jgi:hypothetical protein
MSVASQEKPHTKGILWQKLLHLPSSYGEKHLRLRKLPMQGQRGKEEPGEFGDSDSPIQLKNTMNKN